MIIVHAVINLPDILKAHPLDLGSLFITLYQKQTDALRNLARQ